MSLTAVFFWIAYTMGTCAAVFDPVAGLVLYILVYHLNPEGQWWGLSVRSIGLRTSMTIALATGVGMLMRRPHLEHGARQFQLPYVLAIVFALLALGSLTWGVDVTERGQYQAEKFVKLLIIMFMLIRCVRTPLHYQAVITAWLVGVLYVGYYAQSGVGFHTGGRLDSGLGGPDFAESSDLAVHLVATLPLIGAVFFMARGWWGRIFALATGALAVNTLIATRTRNALAGLAAVAVVGVLSLPRGYRLKGIAAVVVGTLLAVQLTDPGWWNRMATISNYQEGWLQRRSASCCGRPPSRWSASTPSASASATTITSSWTTCPVSRSFAAHTVRRWPAWPNSAGPACSCFSRSPASHCGGLGRSGNWRTACPGSSTSRSLAGERGFISGGTRWPCGPGWSATSPAGCSRHGS